MTMVEKPAVNGLPVKGAGGNDIATQAERYDSSSRGGARLTLVKRLERRQRIIDGFIEVVGRRGFKKAYVNEICQEASVSNRSFYAEFADKDTCFVVAFEQRAWAVTTLAKRAFDEAGTNSATTDAINGATSGATSNPKWEDRIRAGLLAVTEYLAANPNYARFCMIESMRVSAAASEYIISVINACQRVFKVGASFDLPPEIQGEVLGTLLSGMIIHPIIACVRAGDMERLPELVPVLVYLMTLVLLGEERAAPHLPDDLANSWMLRQVRKLRELQPNQELFNRRTG